LIPLRDIAHRVRQAFAATPDQAIVRARAASERLVASVRLGIVLVLVIGNLVVSVGGGNPTFTALMSVGSILYGGILFVFSRKTSAEWVPWLVSTIDVTLASVIIGSFVVFGYPLAAVNNRVAYDWYFVAITLSVLRFDWRLCAFTTLLAASEFLGITWYVSRHWDLSTLSSEAHGTFIPVQFVNRLIMVVGNGVVGVAVAQWARHLRLLIGTDQLTGLLQRRPFFERIDEELQRADFAKTQLSVAIFDVDEFKRFNDQFGHVEGDRALQRIGEQLRNAVRTTDLVARYGGEEFVIAFPRMDVQLAMRRAEGLRVEVEHLRLGEREGQLTISGGVASWPADGQTFEEVLQRADERLYSAKAAGRNLIIGPRPVPLRNAGDPGVG
jgi:diguanylate cyclase (GGDEF)-like protein